METFKQNIKPQQNNGTAYFFYFKNREIALSNTEDCAVVFPEIDSERLIDYLTPSHMFLGSKNNNSYYSMIVKGDEPFLENLSFHSMRALLGKIDDELFFILMYGSHLAQWNMNSQFCGKCSGKTKAGSEEISRICMSCNHTIYPSPYAATITAIIKDDLILLARHAYINQIFTVLAGYVSPGESLEECVAREIKEEVNISVKNIRYFMSQPWGMTQALMVGFVAEYESGEIEVDNKEIIEAAWFSRDDLPVHPKSPSLAHYLIDAFINKTLI
jgi:NAD+ diphosphatase